jgi:hypothetical protein
VRRRQRIKPSPKATPNSNLSALYLSLSFRQTSPKFFDARYVPVNF